VNDFHDGGRDGSRYALARNLCLAFAIKTNQVG
jgi:hypothetical protein